MSVENNGKTGQLARFPNGLVVGAGDCRLKREDGNGSISFDVIVTHYANYLRDIRRYSPSLFLGAISASLSLLGVAFGVVSSPGY